MDWKSRRIDSIVEQALQEDRATEDATTLLTIDAGLRGTGTVVAKQDCVIAGLGSIARVLAAFSRMEGRGPGHFEVVSHPEIFDGVRVRKGQSLAVIRTNARTLLSTERVILNLLQRMSGIATLTRKYADAVRDTRTTVIDTRKTVPGLRVLDKYAVTCGGGENHRLDLADGILIKNNHIALGGGIAAVLANAFAGRKPGQIIDIEVRSFAELAEALDHGTESLLLDNMTPDEVQQCIAMVRERGLSIPIEASGGVDLITVREYALAGPDYISVGALTHSAVAVDLSMRIAAERL
jgi:nicotinate-nucleotide pyrophosphorylase (carboxylating)